MLKNIATTRCECTKKHENKAIYNTDCVTPDLIEDGDNLKENSLKKEVFIFVKNVVLTKN